MDMKEIFEIQNKFQMEAFPDFWKIKDEKDFYNKLLYLGLALSGEVGELNNMIKKLYRSKFFKNEKIEIDKEKIGEELADIFIYIILLCLLLDIDLEKEYLKKLEKNKNRFIK
ncbi:MAG: MazG nucleotide pyrophosphohydrolase domain-containing protein [Nanopusillaceae archaeon]